MTPIAFRMKLKPGHVAEYKRRHDVLWPDLADALRDAGIYDYSIFLDEESLSLFAVLRLTQDNKAGDLPKLPVMRRWWDYMADIMDVNPDNSPVQVSLPSMFYFP
ncbi:MAG: L-rhamnose mutarotase [Niveispirillum sp.]|nr:L-rhamnose mutarotase [Niveispirillum sp.]